MRRQSSLFPKAGPHSLPQSALCQLDTAQLLLQRIVISALLQRLNLRDFLFFAVLGSVVQAEFSLI